jgi:hypothetical protein
MSQCHTVSRYSTVLCCMILNSSTVHQPIKFRPAVMWSAHGCDCGNGTGPRHAAYDEKLGDDELALLVRAMPYGERVRMPAEIRTELLQQILHSVEELRREVRDYHASSNSRGTCRHINCPLCAHGAVVSFALLRCAGRAVLLASRLTSMVGGPGGAARAGQAAHVAGEAAPAAAQNIQDEICHLAHVLPSGAGGRVGFPGAVAVTPWFHCRHVWVSPVQSCPVLHCSTLCSTVLCSNVLFSCNCPAADSTVLHSVIRTLQ